MKKINLGIVGLGVVGSGVYKILEQNREHILSRRGIDLCIKKIVVRNIEKDRGLNLTNDLLTTNIDDVIEDPEIDIIVELIGGVDKPYELVKKSLSNNKHIVTANKALLAYKGQELFELAIEKQMEIGFEASVAGGIPIIRTLKEVLAADRIHSLYGIINGTSNYILTKMIDEAKDFDDCLKQAQELGFAEADPSLDVNGGDAAHKIAILASFAFHTPVSFESVFCEGIENIDLIDISYAMELGYILKLLGIAQRVDDKTIAVRVHPTFIPENSSLAGIKNEFNAILIDSEFLGESMYSGKGAGMFPTANAVMGDIIDIAENIAYNIDYNKFKNMYYESKEIAPIDEMSYGYYLRFNTLDEPGILATISGILAENKISIANVIQKGKHKDKFVHLVLKTHEAKESDLQKALTQIEKMDIVDIPSSVIRIVNA